MNYRAITFRTAIALIAFSIPAAGCSLMANRAAQRTQLQADRANAAADRAEKSAAAAERAARDAMAAADRTDRVVREDTKAIDADIARINYLIAMQDRRRKRHQKSRRRRHGATAPPAAAYPGPGARSTAPGEKE
jgi:hypothetical protein